VPVFVTQGRYSQSAVKAMLAQPEDRGGAVAKLIEWTGCADRLPCAVRRVRLNDHL
jgi:hypothetical protein